MTEWISHFLAFVVTAPTRPAVAAFALMWSTIVVMMIWERRHPAYPVDHRGTWRRDVTAGIVYSVAIIPVAGLISRYLSFTPVLPRQFFAIPFGVRFVMFVVAADFGYYWVHRAMHSKWLWSVHRWHHSPTYMYWLMGVRGSLLQQVLVNIPYILAQALLVVSPWWTGLAILFKNGFQNNWMHLNVRWGPRWLEWFIVTPRYHHVHHSDLPAYYGSNVAAIFPIWDRLFGTYVDPDTVPSQLSFGTNEKAAAWRLAVGV
jgi:sterol desaturase/sphingolipid hydroxylase (fatty acid hydroxylase superfamily)